jgi:hypothetical protein
MLPDGFLTTLGIPVNVEVLHFKQSGVAFKDKDDPRIFPKSLATI